jgi:hypothetical protein
VTASHPIATSAARKNVAGNVPRLILFAIVALGFHFVVDKLASQFRMELIQRILGLLRGYTAGDVGCRFSKDLWRLRHNTGQADFAG